MMKSILLLSVLSILAVIAADDVIVLTKSNFDTEIKSDIILVEFYAPWCGHCKKLEPEYAKAATVLLANDPPVKLGKVDATVETEIAGKFSIKGYPTLKIFRNGVESEYKGPRDADGIISFMKKQVGPSAKTLGTTEEVTKFTETREVSVVGFFDTKDSDLAKTFTSVADTLRESFRFGLVTEKSVLDALEHQQAIVIFKPFDEKKTVYSGSNTNRQEVIDWIYSKSIGLADEITRDNQERYFKRNLPILKVYIDVDYGTNLKRTNYYLNRLKKVAQDPSFEKKLLFAIANKNTYKEELDKVGIPANSEFGVSIEDKNNNLRYKYTETKYNEQNLLSFIKDFIDGKIKPFIKSAPIPEPNDGPVTVVVGENFKDIVLDDSKDVLLEMYAPWCGHCKKLEPIYEELGKKVKKELPNVVIAKMDATANDSPHGKYQAKGYPTILFAPAGKKDNPIAYSGEREVKGFLDFLKQNGNASKKKDEL